MDDGSDQEAPSVPQSVYQGDTLPLEVETHEAAHAVIAIVFDAAIVESISIGKEHSPYGRGRVSFDRPMNVPVPDAPLDTLARAVVCGAGRGSAILRGEISWDHMRSTRDDDGAILMLTERWHRGAHELTLQAFHEIELTAIELCERHGEAIRALVSAVVAESFLDGKRVREIVSPLLIDADVERSRADVATLKARLDQLAKARPDRGPL